MLIGEHLNFNVARILQEFFHVDRAVAEGGEGFALGERYRVDERALGMHDAHPASATAARGFDDDRVANLARDLGDFLRVVWQRAVHAGHDRNAGFLHRELGRDFVAHQANRFSARPDEYEP